MIIQTILVTEEYVFSSNLPKQLRPLHLSSSCLVCVSGSSAEKLCGPASCRSRWCKVWSWNPLWGQHIGKNSVSDRLNGHRIRALSLIPWTGDLHSLMVCHSQSGEFKALFKESKSEKHVRPLTSATPLYGLNMVWFPTQCICRGCVIWGELLNAFVFFTLWQVWS